MHMHDQVEIVAVTGDADRRAGAVRASSHLS